MVSPIEILVHVSGPSRGADDARYRKEASEFLQFNVKNRYTILGRGLQKPKAVRQVHSPVGTETDQPQAVQQVKTSFRAEKAAHDSRIREWTDRLPTFKTPIISRPEASTLPWTTTKQTPHLLIERTPALPRPRTAPTASTPSQAPRLRRSQSDGWHTPPSVIPDSQPTPPFPAHLEVSSSPYLKRPFDSSSPSPTRPASSPAAKRRRLHISSPPPSTNPQVEAQPPSTSPHSSPPSTKRPRLEFPSIPPPQNLAISAYPPALAPSSSPSSPSATNPPTSSPPPPPPPPIDTRQTLEIHPPRPKTSTRAFSTHLTYSLSTIASILPLAKHFQPLILTRPLRTLERGHWLVPISGWNQGLKTEFWTYMGQFVGERGQAGWGTWCVREFVRVRDDGDDGGDEERRVEEVLKVYCWGEVVGEIWLLLFMASKREVKGVGARWVDAGGVAVVVMK